MFIRMSGRFVFNHELWNLGNKIEDAVRPKLNECFGCDLQRSDDIFDIIDFKDRLRWRLKADGFLQLNSTIQLLQPIK